MSSRAVSRPASVLTSLVTSVIREDVRAIAAYPVPNAAGYIKLDAMENPYTLPDDLRAELGTRLAALAVNRYPQPRADALRATLQQVMQIPEGCEILLGNGSDELISIIIAACARPDACVLSLAPGFVMYEMSSKFARLPYVAVPLNADFTLDLPATLAAIAAHRPAVVFVAYPNNPTGSMFARADVEAIIAASPGLVVIDEAYQAFAPDSFMTRLGDFDNLVVMRTVSKSGMAGARLGYMAGPAAWINEFDKVRPPYNINVFTQCYAQLVLEHKDILDAQAAILRSEREILFAALAQRPGITVFPSAANFLLFRVESSDGEAASRIFEALKQRGVLIKNLSRAHPLLGNCLRVTVSSPEENAAFLAALDSSLESVPASASRSESGAAPKSLPSRVAPAS